MNLSLTHRKVKRNLTPSHQETGSFLQGLFDLFVALRSPHLTALPLQIIKPICSFIHLLNTDTEMKKYSLNKDTDNSLQEVLETILPEVRSHVFSTVSFKGAVFDQLQGHLTASMK